MHIALWRQGPQRTGLLRQDIESLTGDGDYRGLDVQGGLGLNDVLIRCAALVSTLLRARLRAGANAGLRASAQQPECRCTTL